MTIARAWLVATLAVACHHDAPPPARPAPAPAATGSVDFAQAERVLEALRGAARGALTPGLIDQVMASPGTDLIVRQQNVSRRVTAAQYRTILAALGADTAPAVEPADASERAARGVRGLRDDVWPALHWGPAHTDLLAERIAALRSLDAGEQARRMASEWLPDLMLPEVALHVVMGGRAGAAALDHDIYFDVLITSFRADAGRMAYPSPRETVEFFAHEAHHVGLGQITDRLRRTLVLGELERRAFDTVVMLVSEGSATFLINAHRDLARVRSDPQYKDHLADPERLLAAFEQVLAGGLAGRLAGEDYDKALTPYVASGFHSAGALLLDAIHRRDGREGVMAVLRDPRDLLGRYNAAAPPDQHRFDPALATRLAGLGSPRS